MSGEGDGPVTVELSSSSDVVKEQPVSRTAKTAWTILPDWVYLAELFIF